MQTLNLVPPIGRGASPWAIGVIALHRLKPSPSHHLIGESRSGLLGFRMDGQLSCPSTIHHLRCHAPYAEKVPRVALCTTTGTFSLYVSASTRKILSFSPSKASANQVQTTQRENRSSRVHTIWNTLKMPMKHRCLVPLKELQHRYEFGAYGPKSHTYVHAYVVDIYDSYTHISVSV